MQIILLFIIDKNRAIRYALHRNVPTHFIILDYFHIISNENEVVSDLISGVLLDWEFMRNPSNNKKVGSF